MADQVDAGVIGGRVRMQDVRVLTGDRRGGRWRRASQLDKLGIFRPSGIEWGSIGGLLTRRGRLECLWCCRAKKSMFAGNPQSPEGEGV